VGAGAGVVGAVGDGEAAGGEAADREGGQAAATQQRRVAGGQQDHALSGHDGTQPGDPAKAAAAILAALDAERTPLRLPLGNDSVDAILTHLDGVRSDLATWEKTARGTDFDAR